MPKLDVLAFGAHPDDVELSCGGTLVTLQRQGYRTGIIDLTRGERGTQGDRATREQEAEKAAGILQLAARENLALPDCGLRQCEEHRRPIIAALRQYTPTIVLAPAPQDRHPDHGHASTLVTDACFYAGLSELDADGLPHRPDRVLYYMQNEPFAPDFMVDISDVHDIKMEAIRTFTSQFTSAGGDSPRTQISTADFLPSLEARARYLGQQIGVTFAEGYQIRQGVPVADIVNTFRQRGHHLP